MVFNVIILLLLGGFVLLGVLFKMELKCDKSEGYCFKRKYIGEKLKKEEKLCAVSDVSCAEVGFYRHKCLLLKLKDEKEIPLWGTLNQKFLYDDAEKVNDFLKNEDEELVIKWRSGLGCIVILNGLLFILLFTSFVVSYFMQ